jgi:hypothetical protein
MPSPNKRGGVGESFLPPLFEIPQRTFAVCGNLFRFVESADVFLVLGGLALDFQLEAWSAAGLFAAEEEK